MIVGHWAHFVFQGLTNSIKLTFNQPFGRPPILRHRAENKIFLTMRRCRPGQHIAISHPSDNLLQRYIDRHQILGDHYGSLVFATYAFHGCIYGVVVDKKVSSYRQSRLRPFQQSTQNSISSRALTLAPWYSPGTVAGGDPAGSAGRSPVALSAGGVRRPWVIDMWSAQD